MDLVNKDLEVERMRSRVGILRLMTHHAHSLNNPPAAAVRGKLITEVSQEASCYSQRGVLFVTVCAHWARNYTSRWHSRIGRL